MKKVLKKNTKSVSVSTKKRLPKSQIHPKSPLFMMIISTLIILGSITYIATKLIPTKTPDINETVITAPSELDIFAWTFDTATDYGTNGWELYSYTQRTAAQKARIVDGSLIIPSAIAKTTSLLVNDLSTSDRPRIALAELPTNSKIVVEVTVKSLKASPTVIAPTQTTSKPVYDKLPKHTLKLSLSSQNKFTTTSKSDRGVTRTTWTWKPELSKETTMGLIPQQEVVYSFIFDKSELSNLANISSMQLLLNPSGTAGFSNLAITNIKFKRITSTTTEIPPAQNTVATGTVTKYNLEGQVGYNLTLDAGGVYELKSNVSGVIESSLGKHVEVIGVLSAPTTGEVSIPRANNPILTITTITVK